MAHHKSAIKRIRQNETRRIRNRSIKSSMRTAVRRLEQVIRERKDPEARTLLHKTLSIIDRAASKGVIHKNKASRSVARLTRKVKALG